MAKIKEIYMELQEKYGEEVEITEEFFTSYLKEKEIIKENKNSEEEE